MKLQLVLALASFVSISTQADVKHKVDANGEKRPEVACDAELELDDETDMLKVELLQTKLHVSPVKRSATLPNGESPFFHLASLNASWSFAPNCSGLIGMAVPGLATRALLLQVSAISAISTSSDVNGLVTKQAPLAWEQPTSRFRAWCVMAAYLLLYLYSVSTMAYHMSYTPRQYDLPKGEISPSGRNLPNKVCLEEETYRRSFIEWLTVSWISPIVAKLGHSWNSAMSKCRPDELPQFGNQEHQALQCNQRFERLWNDEIEAVGEDRASLYSVLVKLWTVKDLVTLTAVLFIHIVFMQIYQVILIQHSLGYFYWLQDYVSFHGQLPDMTGPVIASICYFSVVPLSNIVLCTVESSIQSRLDQACVGIGVSVFRKTQRLPLAKLVSDAKKGPTEAEADESRTPNLIVLIQSDIIMNLHGFAFSLAMCANSFAAVAVLLVLMTVQLGLATFFCMAVAIPGIVLSVILTGGLAINIRSIQECMDRRGEALREIFQAIRVVKCYAWEEAMEAKVQSIRTMEVGCLKSYFRLCGNLVCLFNAFPRLLILSGLWGYTHLYRHHDVAGIFACLQILSSLRASCEMFAGNIGRVMSVTPSIQRIERYLKLEETPVQPGIRVPSWAKIWDDSSDLTVPEATKSEAVKVSGSFAWSSEKHSPIVLHDLKLNVPKGELVAVVGSVGSGKSTLLQAALGELYPVQPAGVDILLSRPKICAYCPQVPHIVEGTLRANVLFGQPYDPQRYLEAIRAASLENDLKLLPGGDNVLIGARGISLSGGQRARVALARAAYHQHAELALIDDPFGAVDAPTASTIMEKLLLGPLMQRRTRLVVLQPEIERLRRFDRVLILAQGRIVADGTPGTVFESDEFKKLLRSDGSSDIVSDPEDSPGAHSVRRQTSQARQPSGSADDSFLGIANPLREGEHEGRPTWTMVKSFCSMGRWRNLINALLLFSVQLFLFLLSDLSLANWTNVMTLDQTVSATPYLAAYLFWLFVGMVVCLVAWDIGMRFSLNISSVIHTKVLHHLLKAPIDRFFDKHPVGRIMNRLTGDMATIDLYLFAKVSGSIIIVYQTLLPLLYIHAIMPWIITVLSIPFYYVVYKFYMRYQNSTVPLRYCAISAGSICQSCVTDVLTTSVVVRGFGECDRIAEEYADASNDAMKASLTDERLLKRWLVNRLSYLWSFYNSTVFLVGLYNPLLLGSGTLGICLTNLLLLEAMIEPNLELMCGALFELIALARVHEYLDTPQEMPRQAASDVSLRNYVVRFLRKQAPDLSMKQTGETVEVLNAGCVVLRSSKDGRALVAATDIGLIGLCPTCSDLAEASLTHRIVAANDAVGCAKLIAEELCKTKKSFITASGFSTAPQVVLELQSSWMQDGAHVEVEQIRLGYGDSPRDVLNGVTFSVLPKMKVGIVGTTGCGKSSMLLALLRILEPRSGQIMINGIDTRDVGLATLRTAIGLVPQDPMLFSGTLRHNLDPFKQYTDGRVKHAVRCAHLEDVVKRFPLGLDHQITEDGANLSFGQRQLLCIARMVLRQPALLLLDEATSAIDPHTQELVQDTIISAFPSSTVLAVAHRLETIMDFDQVVVMDQGVVAEVGPVKEVASRSNGIFNRMLAAKQKW